jgi:uncharacterized alpha/beta hydrolase family protein
MDRTNRKDPVEVPTDDLIAGLRDRREALAAELAAIDGAIAALGGGGSIPAVNHMLSSAGPRRVSVGDDKVEAVREYIRARGKVRQADITNELQFNSGTISQATHALMLAGEIERGPKEDRSVTWRVKK